MSAMGRDASPTGQLGGIAPVAVEEVVSFHHLLFVWLSPSFPTGAFAYSHGLEMAAERGLLPDRPALEDWLSALVTNGSLRNDLILLAAAYRAMTAHDDAAFVATNALALAMQPGAERYLETTQQGGSFLLTSEHAWPHADLDRISKLLNGDVAYPVAVSMAAAGHAVPLTTTLVAFGLAFVINLTSAAIRLGIVGQTAAQSIIAALAPQLRSAATATLSTTLDDIGGATFSADLAALEHETQYSRLFRS